MYLMYVHRASMVTYYFSCSRVIKFFFNTYNNANSQCSYIKMC